MFGEHEDGETGPRLPSPWQPFMLPSYKAHNSIENEGELVPIRIPAGQRSIKLQGEVDDEGHIEYKLHLPPEDRMTPLKFQRLVTQLRFRLVNGGGEALYELGIKDDGTLIGLEAEEMNSTIDTLERMARHLGASVEVVRRIEIEPEPNAIILPSSPDDCGTPELGCAPETDTTPSQSTESSRAASYLDLPLEALTLSESPADNDAVGLEPAESQIVKRKSKRSCVRTKGKQESDNVIGLACLEIGQEVVQSAPIAIEKERKVPQTSGGRLIKEIVSRNTGATRFAVEARITLDAITPQERYTDYANWMEEG